MPACRASRSWVDFDALADAARSAGWQVEALATQTTFLVELGIDAVFAVAYAQAPDEAARYGLA